jgi:hypothetical protein
VSSHLQSECAEIFFDSSRKATRKALPDANPASCMVVLRLGFAWQAILFRNVSFGIPNNVCRGRRCKRRQRQHGEIRPSIKGFGNKIHDSPAVNKEIFYWSSFNYIPTTLNFAEIMASDLACGTLRQFQQARLECWKPEKQKHRGRCVGLTH